MNQSKAPLLLMEQVIMLLVFSLAAALCVRAFFLADSRSQQNEARDYAVVQAQSAAEAYKTFLGDPQETSDLLQGWWEGTCLYVSYDENWQPVEGSGTYLLRIEPQDSAVSTLGKATLQVTDAKGSSLVTLPVAWQKGGDADA